MTSEPTALEPGWGSRTRATLASALPQRLRAPLGIALGGAALSLALFATAPSNEPAPREEKAWAVSVTPAQITATSPELLLFGRVETPKAADLNAGVTGDVAEVLVEEGGRVEKNQLMVRLDARDARLALREREAELSNRAAMLDSLRTRHAAARAVLVRHRDIGALLAQKLERHDRLHAADMLPAATLDEVRREAEQHAIATRTRASVVADHPNLLRQHEAQLELARARVERARLDLERTEIRAPFAARIAALHVTAGERVERGAPLLEVYDTRALEVRAQIPAPRVPALRRALDDAGSTRGEIVARVDIDGERLDLRLDRLAGRVVRGRGGVDALFEVASPARSLAPGRVVELDVQLPVEADVVAVPAQALYADSRIYTVSDDRLRAVEVERIGERTAASGRLDILVRSAGLGEGDAIATTWLPRAVDGLKVSVNRMPD